jgi:hypothetical protein
VSEIPFAVGQRWQYQTASGQPSPILTIAKIDDSPDGRIIHISILDTGHCIARSVSHLPIAEKALRDSVTNLVSVDEPYLGFQEGYDQWKEAFDQGVAGVFTISVDDVLESLLLTVEHGDPCEEHDDCSVMDGEADDDDGESWKRGIPPVGGEE